MHCIFYFVLILELHLALGRESFYQQSVPLKVLRLLKHIFRSHIVIVDDGGNGRSRGGTDNRIHLRKPFEPVALTRL